MILSTKLMSCSKSKIRCEDWSDFTVCIYTLLCFNTRTPKPINFPFGTNGKVMVLGVPILKHNRIPVWYVFFFVFCFAVSTHLGQMENQWF